MIPGRSDSLETKLFLGEIQTLQTLRHPNLVPLIGAVLSVPALAIVPHYESGTLYDYLKREPELESAKQLRFALDIARALEFLSARKTVLRQLRTTTCFVDKDENIKVHCFRTSPILHEADYFKPERSRYCFSSIHVQFSHLERSELSESRWLAPESIKNLMFNAASDVFAFGLVCLELSTSGAEPFAELSSKELITVTPRQSFAFP